MMRSMSVYIDLKSPYAYLALEPTRALAHGTGIALDWLPYVLDIPSYLGAARVDAAGTVIESARSDAQWRKVRYAYMDARRYATLRGLTIRGTQKIWDTTLFGKTLLWTKQTAAGRIDALLDALYEPFWRRALDAESPDVLRALLSRLAIPTDGFDDYVAGPGHDDLARVMDEAHARGVFGVPSYVLDDELFFGREHLPLIRRRLEPNADPVDSSAL
jgi:2-hydroxychromene-2-carboxylate isomerase